jgi:hypothetical protein
MSQTIFLSDKPKQWWHIWSCDNCTEPATTDKSTETRSKILMSAFDEIYHRGFQAARSLSDLGNRSEGKSF